jgi:hypothetical protein
VKGKKEEGAAVATPFSPFTFRVSRFQAVKLLPHPQPPVELGLLKVKPEPCIELT